jgi:hypothetical protein
MTEKRMDGAPSGETLPRSAAGADSTSRSSSRMPLKRRCSPRLAGIPHRIGFATQGRSHLLTCRLQRGPEHRNRHQIGDYLELVAASEQALSAAPIFDQLMNPHCRDWSVVTPRQAAGDRLLARAGSASQWGRWLPSMSGRPTVVPKCWPAGHCCRAGDRLTAAQPVRTIMLIGGPGEVECGKRGRPRQADTPHADQPAGRNDPSGAARAPEPLRAGHQQRYRPGAHCSRAWSAHPDPLRPDQ